MRIWIDATTDTTTETTKDIGSIEVFGIPLLERVLRGLVESQQQVSVLQQLKGQLDGLVEAQAYITGFIRQHLEPTEVRIELAEGSRMAERIPADLLRKLPIRWSIGTGSVRDRLTQATCDADGEPLLALSADSIIDTRLIEHLVWASEPKAFFHGTGPLEATVLRLDAPLRDEDTDPDCQDLNGLAHACVDRGLAKELAPGDFDGYIRKLRRTEPPYVFRIQSDDSARSVERFLFSASYKGCTDFLTKYVYPPLVWRAVVPLAQRGVKPNTVTAIGIFCCFAAVPLFAAGWWLPALLLAYSMSVLDSVDGKLARVTFTSSKQGDVLDHGTDWVHPPIWYFAWAWGLSAGDPFSPVFKASLWLAGIYIVDRLLETVFKSCTGGRSVQDITPFDAKLRTIVSRRNVNLAIFTVALPFGLGIEAFYAVLGLQAATAVYHLIRVIQYWDYSAEREPRGASVSRHAETPLQVALSSGGIGES